MLLGVLGASTGLVVDGRAQDSKVSGLASVGRSELHAAGRTFAVIPAAVSAV
jgi:hypothetical protein